jgi:hypothetical protein
VGRRRAAVGALLSCAAICALGGAGAALAQPSAGAAGARHALLAVAKLGPSDASGAASFGYSVAFSSDGTTAIVGGPKDAGGVGAAWVFARSGSAWTQQGPKLTATGERGAGAFGQSVALSADGSTALVGSPEDSIPIGAAWVFVRAGTTWTQQARLLGSKPGPTVQDGLGISVALSGDGNTALVGAENFRDTVGAAFAYRRTGTKWAHFGKILTGALEVGKGQFGTAVSLSSDGTTAAIGAPGDASSTGAVWIYAFGKTGWTQQSPKLTSASAAGTQNFGCSTALSANGATALVGACRAGSGAGAAYVFTRTGTKWSTAPVPLMPTGEKGPGIFGTSVALDAGGATAVVGAPFDNSGAGAAWTFRRTGAAWKQGKRLTASAPKGASAFGWGVGLTGDGKTAIAGGPNDASGVGAVWLQPS